MERGCYKLLPVLIVMLISCIGTFYSTSADASNHSHPLHGPEMAFHFEMGDTGPFYGPPYYSPVYPGPIYRRNVYWTGWRYIGYGCERSCLISSWDGQILRCKRRC
jgi:hypothetical protein